MDFTPAFLITAGVSAVALIVWLVRGEGKTNANAKCFEDLKVSSAKDLADLKISHAKELADLKASYDEEMREARLDIKDTRDRFFKHIADTVLHHNAEATTEFRLALERRFVGMDDSLKDIARKLNHLAGRE